MFTAVSNAISTAVNRVFSTSVSEPAIYQYPRIDAERIDGVDGDQVFKVLKNERRRLVIQVLSECNGNRWVPLRTLAEDIASIQNDTPIQDLSSQEVKRVYTSLYQSHLKKLAAVDAVEYNDRATAVRPGENTQGFVAALAALDQLLDHAFDADPSEPDIERNDRVNLAD